MHPQGKIPLMLQDSVKGAIYSEKEQLESHQMFLRKAKMSFFFFFFENEGKFTNETDTIYRYSIDMDIEGI